MKDQLFVTRSTTSKLFMSLTTEYLPIRFEFFLCAAKSLTGPAAWLNIGLQERSQSRVERIARAAYHTSLH